MCRVYTSFHISQARRKALICRREASNALLYMQYNGVYEVAREKMLIPVRAGEYILDTGRIIKADLNMSKVLESKVFTAAANWPNIDISSWPPYIKWKVQDRVAIALNTTSKTPFKTICKP